MQDDVDAAACLSTCLRIANVGLDETMPAPLFGRHGRLHLVQVAPVARGEVVEAGDRLAELEQALHEMRTDEARTPGDEPP